MSTLEQQIRASVLIACITLIPVATAAQDAGKDGQDSMGASMSMGMARADSQAPLGVVGGDMMAKGKWMLSYRFMRMEMEDNLIGSDSVSPEKIVTTVPNRFFGLPGQPPTLRVVPTKMRTDMHMFSAMYAPTEQLTLMGMIPYIERSMDHVTFQGPAGTTRLGTFTTKADGIGDLKLMGLYSAWKSGNHRVHLNAGVSLPTGSIDKEDEVLTPMGARPTQRLPYPNAAWFGHLRLDARDYLQGPIGQRRLGYTVHGYDTSG
jgi:hypothetical protein